MTPKEIAEKYFPEPMIKEPADKHKRDLLILCLADDIEIYARQKRIASETDDRNSYRSHDYESGIY